MGCFALFIVGSGITNTNFSHALLLPSQYYQYHPSKSTPISSQLPPSNSFFHSSTTLHAKPKRGSIVDSYQTVSVNCKSCKNRLFRYKKKNGTKSNLIKCYVERIVYEDQDGILEQQLDNFAELSENDQHKWTCPKCGINWGRSSLIHGMPAIKLVGGKTRMTKK
ncbi:hypothetical protein ACHAXR_011365 [Thalassiosira sp. AJA248-18]